MAEKILSLLPAPNATGTNNGTVDNYSANGSGSFNDYQYTGRVDYSVSRSCRFSAATRTPTSCSPVIRSSEPKLADLDLGYLGSGGPVADSKLQLWQQASTTL